MPHCGWIRSVPIKVMEDASVTTVVRGHVVETFADLASHIKSIFDDSQFAEANSWVALKCPHCGNVYQYNARTGEIRK